jgi:hypothetical protein
MYPTSWRAEFENIVAGGGDIVDVLDHAKRHLGEGPVSSLLFALQDIFNISPKQMNAIHGWRGFHGAATYEELCRLVPLH